MVQLQYTFCVHKILVQMTEFTLESAYNQVYTYCYRDTKFHTVQTVTNIKLLFADLVFHKLEHFLSSLTQRLLIEITFRLTATCTCFQTVKHL